LKAPTPEDANRHSKDELQQQHQQQAAKGNRTKLNTAAVCCWHTLGYSPMRSIKNIMSSTNSKNSS